MIASEWVRTVTDDGEGHFTIFLGPDNVHRVRRDYPFTADTEAAAMHEATAFLDGADAALRVLGGIARLDGAAYREARRLRHAAMRRAGA